MVAQARHVAAFLCALALGAAILSACSDETQIAGLDNGVQLHIGVAPDSIAASWILVRPDGTEITGQGDALVPAREAGEYWLLWEPVPGWDPPVVNPALYLHEDGDAGDLVGQYRLRKHRHPAHRSRRARHGSDLEPDGTGQFLRRGSGLAHPPAPSAR